MPAPKRKDKKRMTTDGIEYTISDKVMWMGDDPGVVSHCRETAEFIKKHGLPEFPGKKKPWSIEDLASILPNGND